MIILLLQHHLKSLHIRTFTKNSRHVQLSIDTSHTYSRLVSPLVSCNSQVSLLHGVLSALSEVKQARASAIPPEKRLD